MSTTFETESTEIKCECGFVCYGVSAIKLHDIDHKIEEHKKQFRYHFGHNCCYSKKQMATQTEKKGTRQKGQSRKQIIKSHFLGCESWI